jgi:cellulose synthase/poly-beta-1,6-N-acetylglucosamine synthase-like glycosyltransferase
MWINIFILFTFFLLIPYCILITYYRKWFLQLRPFQLSNSFEPTLFFSIIIPARNEAENIANCLQSIVNQNYPTHLFEIIVVDDHSTDSTSLLVAQFQALYPNILLIKLEDELQGKKLNAYKKKAIDIAIQQSRGNWIITTDADCIAQPNWLKLYDEYIHKSKSLFVAAPVMFTKTKSTVSQFQYIDFMALQAATAATVSVGLHSMCNGANLAYNKAAFYNVAGFKGIDNIASGDDMLLMNKIKKAYPKQIGYLFSKDAIITTSPMPNWTSFLNQRIRWASKADKYEDKSLLPVLLGVYLLNLSLFLMFFAAFFVWKLVAVWIVLMILKTIVEWFYIKSAAVFFGKLNFLQFAFLQPLHITYMVVAGWLGKFGNYKWKGRSVS